MNQENNDEVEMQGHSYDGITELDNPLPMWWLWTFFITIIFAFLYFIHYEFNGGPTLKQELATAMEEIEQHKAQAPKPEETEESLAAAMKGDAVLAAGAQAFATKCAACHGPQLQGQIGPNLTDNYWIHGKGTRMDIIKVVRDGVPDKGMPTWGPLLSQDELYGVVAYIISKKGSNPPNPKAPQGEAVQ